MFAKDDNIMRKGNSLAAMTVLVFSKIFEKCDAACAVHEPTLEIFLNDMVMKGTVSGIMTIPLIKKARKV